MQKEEGGKVSPYVLSLDPSLANTGYVVYECVKGKWIPVEHGIIKTEKSQKKFKVSAGDDMVRRWRIVVQKLKELHAKYLFSALVAELTPGGVQNASAAQSLYGAKALIISFSELMDIPGEFVTPRNVKIALCKTPGAAKAEMMIAADKLTGIGKDYKATKTSKNPYALKFEHVADAVGAFEYVRHSSPVIKLITNSTKA
jgi:Holliday junction resolvasome RuvABC endonuclease subunit